MAMKDVMVVMELELLNILKISDKLQELLIPMLLPPTPAKLQEETTEFMELLKSLDALKLKTLSKEDLWLLELMLLTGTLTNLVSLTTVILKLTMLSF